MVELLPADYDPSRSTRPVRMSATERLVLHTYGGFGVMLFRAMADQMPDEDEAALLQRFYERPTPNTTRLFRQTNVSAIGEMVVPRLSAAGNTDISIWQIGCSMGHESYSLAAATLANNNEQFHITAIDTDPRNLATAEAGRYPWVSLQGLSLLSQVSETYLDEEYFTGNGKQVWLPDYHVVDQPSQETYIEATAALKRHITFRQHDLLDGPIGGQHDVIIINHVLQHYPTHTRDRMMGHIAVSLGPEGVLAVAPGLPPLEAPVDGYSLYQQWLQVALRRHGFEPYVGDDSGELFQLRG